MALRAVEIGEATNDIGAVAQAHNILGVLRSRADFDEAFKHLEMSLALAGTLMDPGAGVAVLNNLALVRSDAASYAGCDDICGDRCYSVALHPEIWKLVEW